MCSCRTYVRMLECISTQKWSYKVQEAGACLQVPAAPATSFSLDTFGFCKPGIFEFLLMLIFLCLSIANVFVGSAAIDITGYFGFYLRGGTSSDARGAM